MGKSWLSHSFFCYFLLLPTLFVSLAAPQAHAAPKKKCVMALEPWRSGGEVEVVPLELNNLFETGVAHAPVPKALRKDLKENSIAT